MTWRTATREEITTYYEEEFPTYLDDLPPFITAGGPKEYAIAFRDPYPVRKSDVPDKEFIRRATWQTDASGERTTPQFETIDDVLEFVRHPARNDPLTGSPYILADPSLIDGLDPSPDAVYYALNHWDRPWIILVDIDAKTIAQNRAEELVAPDDESQSDDVLEAAGIRDADPVGYPYAFEDVDRAIEYGFAVRDIFEDDFDADETMVMYTGQGVHVYLLDGDPAHRYDEQSREVLNDLLLDGYGIPIDPVVTADRRRVARLPYSLHAEVCRVVQPIDSPHFDVQSATPERFES
ncbi:DNA primase [Halopenitus salinus]|uniref:DNA primase n=1 Tax=Halopenitus salinus TaxID=1198295 RepID=A0ABD5UWS9_9EURY